MCTGAPGEIAFQLLGSSCPRTAVPDDGGARKPVPGLVQIYLLVIHHHGAGREDQKKVLWAPETDAEMLCMQPW